MRKKRMVPTIFLAVLLVAAITLPQGFATTIPPHKTKNYGNHNQYAPHSIIVQPAPNSTTPKAPAQQSGNVLVMHGVELLGNQVLELKEGSAFATSIVNV
jgi:hypothetical protein